MKRIITLMVAFILILSSGFLNVEAAGEFVIDSSGTLTKYNGKGGNVVIPDTVSYIGDSAFRNCEINSVVIPNSVVSIGEYAFENNNLTFVHIPDSVKRIEQHAFIWNKLSTITIPKSVTFIGSRAFACNSLTSVFMEEGIKANIDDSIFGSGTSWDNNNIQYITIPKSLEGSNIDDILTISKYPGIYKDSYAYSIVQKYSRNHYLIDFSYNYVFGPGRYETSEYAADYLKKLMNVNEFGSVVIASGSNYPDALSGSHLADKNGAPILLINQKHSKNVQNYIRENVKYKGTVYVLGGQNAVPDSWLGNLKSSYSIVRLAGSDRYKTNVEIIKRCGFSGGDILVCAGKGYADSLSASAVNKPILLAGKKLNNEQKSLLNSLKSKGLKFHIIGGTSAVSNSFVNELKAYGTVVNRYEGADRYDTSTELAEAFFGTPKTVVLAYGGNYPDGLCAGPIARKLGAPLILTKSSKSVYSKAVRYCTNRKIKKAVVLGGPSLVGEGATWRILGFKD